MALIRAHSALKNLMYILNHECRATLLDIPGLGPKKVDLILEKRSRSSRKLDVKDITDIGGMGPVTLTRMTEEPETPTVVKFAVFYLQLAKQQHPSIALSLDFGISNSAYAQLDEHFNLLEWQKIDLGMPRPYSPQICHESLTFSINQLPPSDVYVLEEQSHRSVPTRGFLGIGVELRILEAMTFAIIKSLTDRPVYSLSAKRVAQYFAINTKNHLHKKAATITLVKSLISPSNSVLTPMGNKLSVPLHLIQYLDDEKKKDDLCDCLLQAIAFMEWNKMTKDLE